MLLNSGNSLRRFVMWCGGLFLVAAAVAGVPGCAGKKQEPKTNSSTALPIYAQYNVGASEGDSMATCMLQFFTNVEKTQTLWLEAPAEVRVDGQVVVGDSARITGAYYEYQQPLASFKGRHVIAYRHVDGMVAEEQFDFPVFTLATVLPEILPVTGFRLPVQGLPDGMGVQLVLTDTSFAGAGVSEREIVENGFINITNTHLASLKRGPVVLRLSAEMDRPLQGALRGTLSVSYSLTRSFELQ